MRITSNIRNSAVAGVALAAVLGSSIFTANTSNAAENWVLGSAQPKITGMAQTLKNVFVPRLENFSNGQIEVEEQFLTGLCNEHTCIEQMLGGLIRLATASTENAGAFGSDIDLFNDLPYIFKDLEWGRIRSPPIGCATN